MNDIHFEMRYCKSRALFSCIIMRFVHDYLIFPFLSSEWFQGNRVISLILCLGILPRRHP